MKARLVFILVLFLAVTLQGCSLFFPGQSKAETEKKQLTELKKQTLEMQKQTKYDSLKVELMKERNEILKNN